MTTGVLDKARVLVEALPYIRRYSGRVVVVKYGGHAMTSATAVGSFARDIALMHYVGIHPVVVHGGGPQISELMMRLDQTPSFVDGHRVTGAQELDVVRMVLQKTNKELVSAINEHGDIAVGISGEDAGLLRASPLQSASGQDLGFVGSVEAVHPRVALGLVESGFVPVVAPIGVGAGGQAFNINADLVAGALARSLRASKLVYLTDVDGLYRDLGDSGSLISSVSASELERMAQQGSLSEGMIPKAAGCVEAVRGGVERAHILDGGVEHALLLEVFTDSGVGTMVEAS
ncbi:MAG TPA: acetylglutamate kinase [Actinomycetota bacterium]|nr:acetylglutamate kinase [Actinomycetota bacterium]